MEAAQTIGIIAASGTLATALAAVWVYYKNSKLERAKWALSLYEKFYERKDLKEIRDILDNEPGDDKVDDLVLRCSTDLADYLNFFEFVAFLEKENQLRRAEINALFDYYLKCLKKHPRVIKFVRDYGYEDLTRLLESWK